MQLHIEGAGVKGIGGMGGGHHRLLQLKRRARSQAIGARCMERHKLGLYHALPRVVARGPRCGLGVGGIGIGT